MSKGSSALTGAIVAIVTAGAMLPFIAATRARDEGASPKEAEAPPLPDRFDAQAIDAHVAHVLKTKKIPAAQLTIAIDGKVVLARAYGDATLDTAFAVGSVTKQFTCASALLLEEEGKLSMQDKVAKYYPDLTRAADITLDDLGAHVSGYPDYYPLDFYDRRMPQPIAADDLIHRYATGKLDFAPRERWSYSNTGYVILARVVERASGQPFGDLLAQRVFKPLGMSHATFEPADDAAGLARGHTSYAGGDPRPTPRERLHWLHGAGALYASANDLVTWDLALIDGKVLKPESLKAMTMSRTLAGGRSTEYGCGLDVSTRARETVLSHGGEVSGFLAHSAIVPRTRSAVALLQSRDDVNLAGLFDAIVRLVLDANEPPPPKVDGAPAKETVRATFVAMQRGEVDRRTLGDDFNAYLTDATLRDAAARLAPLGEPTNVEKGRVSERGGMEVSRFLLTFANGSKRKVLMFRSASGKIEELLIEEP
jgi:CubicO group peptidase (beta-lactamase class C family)